MTLSSLRSEFTFMEKPRNSLTKPLLIIFDCDGVLFDSRRANRLFYNQVLEEFGRPPLSDKDLEYVHTHTVIQSVDYLFQDDPRRETAQRFRQGLDYTPFIRAMEMEADLIPFLTYIRPRIKTAINTNRTQTIHQVLKQFGLDGYFDLVISALDVSRPKPDPESLYKILSHFQVKAEACFYVGDSEIDAETARRAGVPLIAFKNPELEATRHVRGFKELQGHLEKQLDLS